MKMQDKRRQFGIERISPRELPEAKVASYSNFADVKVQESVTKGKMYGKEPVKPGKCAKKVWVYTRPMAKGAKHPKMK